WTPAEDAAVIGVDVVLAALLTPVLPGLMLLALAGVGVPAGRANPGPIRWTLVHAASAAGGALVAALALLWLSYQPDDWPGFVGWSSPSAWIAVAAGLLRALACGWWFARGTFEKAPRRAPGRPTRVRGYAAAVAAGVVCALWWFAVAAPLHIHNRCVWATTVN